MTEAVPAEVVAVSIWEKVHACYSVPFFSRGLQVAKAAFQYRNKGISSLLKLVSDVYMRKQLKIPILAEVHVNIVNLLKVLKMMMY